MVSTMKVAGIIAEYNPFHLGHAHQIRLLKEAGFDYVVVCMSGDFVQRGAPAIVDKYARTRMALSCGADLVLELPSLFAVSSAEYFATAGVRLLASLGCVDTLCFGYEGDFGPEIKSLLAALADYLNKEPVSYQTALQAFLRDGFPYPAARAKALSQVFPEAASFLQYSNNILALEYTRAIRRFAPGLELFPIPRADDGYHGMRSAEAIRTLLFSGEPIEAYLPAEAFAALSEAIDTQGLTASNDFSAMLSYKLLLEEDFSGYADCSEDLSRKLIKVRSRACTFSGLVSLLKTKDLTYTRISRVLLNIMLNRRQETLSAFSGEGKKNALYAKMLGFRRDASTLLSAVKKSAEIPYLSKNADAAALLHSDAMRLFSLDICASKIYHLVCSEKTGTLFPNDYEHPLEIL